MLKKSLLILFISCSIFRINAQDDWKLAKEGQDLKVYTKASDNSEFNQVKGVLQLDASIESFIAILHDLENFHEWGYRVKDVDILERVGDTIQIYYSIAKAPFPYKNRDGIYANIFSWNPEKSELEVRIEMRDDYMELNSGMVRVKGSGKWLVSLLPNNKLEVTLQMQMDPGGGIPAWLSNLFIEDSPYHTLKNLREKIKDDKYQNKTYSFIQEVDQ